jgi:hypothetical protein
MPIKPFAARHTTDDLGDMLKITIPSQKQWFQILFIGFWLVGWAFGEVTVLRSLISGNGFGGPSLFMIAWLGGWTIGGGYAIYILFWQLVGNEIIQVSNYAITTSRSILGFGFPKEYSSEYIKTLRVSSSPSSNDMFGWSRASRFYGVGGGLLAFDYGSKTVKFGAGIDEAEAKQILSEIQQRYPQYRTKVHLESV